MFFQLQQASFHVEARGIACERAVGADDAVAGDEDGDGVAMHRLSDGLCRAAADASGDLAIAHRGAVGDVQQFLPHLLLKRRALRVQRREKARIHAAEVTIEPTTGFHKYREIVVDRFLLSLGKI